MAENSDFRVDIDEALTALGQFPYSETDLRLLSPDECGNILVTILNRFTTLGDRGLTEYCDWDSFKEPKYSVRVEHAPADLCRVVPLDEPVWFVAEDWYRNKPHDNFWLYEGKIETICNLLNEMYEFRYYVVSKTYDWLISENPQDCLIGVGSSIVEKMQYLVSIGELWAL
ncbi:MAG: hypothetical protein HC895_14960 [Leptolyngbyaceae cyanobacterium SM1_3_5]|nr:hypothetical protein [Leptolyngbyaceae cyanobacterium SM1_3_5]